MRLFNCGKADDVLTDYEHLTRLINDVFDLRKYYSTSWSRNQKYDIDQAVFHLRQAQKYFSYLSNSVQLRRKDLTPFDFPEIESDTF